MYISISISIYIFIFIFVFLFLFLFLFIFLFIYIYIFVFFVYMLTAPPQGPLCRHKFGGNYHNMVTRLALISLPFDEKIGQAS